MENRLVMNLENLENKIGFQISFLIHSGKSPEDTIRDLKQIAIDFHNSNIGEIRQNNVWTKIEDKLPEQGLEVLCFNKNWICEDFNKNGTRIGFLNGDNEFTTAHWWDYQDTYMTISKHDCQDEIFSENIKNNTEPTHWKNIEKSPIY